MTGVTSIRDLHVWSITSGQNTFSCHVVGDGSICILESQKYLGLLRHQLEHKSTYNHSDGKS